MRVLSAVENSDNLTLDILAHLRVAGLYGARFGAPDELLLHSGGPQSDLARKSMLMGPATRRFIVRQPSRVDIPILNDQKSPLKGELTIAENPSLVTIEFQFWEDGWKTDEICQSIGLAEGLRKCATILSDGKTLEFEPGGLAGLLTYDMVQFTEPLKLRHPPDEGEVLMILYRSDRWILHNRTENRLEVHSSIKGDPWKRQVEPILNEPIPNRAPTSIVKSHSPNTESDSMHAAKVRRTQEAIREGVLYQLNYGRTWTGPIESPWNIFERLVQSNPAPCAAWLHAPDMNLAVASSSPELLLRQDGRKVSTRPIKGTRPRGYDAEHDANLRGELVGSQKEIAEHLMLVDLERNDLGRICKSGSIQWKRWRIESYPNVQHMVSEIEGTLREGFDGFDALHSIFPGGSITGCPKSATIAAIDEIEEKPRRVWTGSIGHIDPRTGISEWNILIRTLEARQVADKWHATVQAGGGLVIESNPIEEVEEAKWKAQALCQAAWGYSPIGRVSNSVQGTDAVSLHPIPLVTPVIRRIMANRDPSLLSLSTPETIPPRVWKEGDLLDKPVNKRVVFIDNLDSFSWNIVHAFASLGAEVIIVPGRTGTLSATHLIESLNPTHIILGPGPGRPEQSKLTMGLAQFALKGESPPLLGICLGHQAIGVAAGWPLTPSPLGAVHGVPENIEMKNKQLTMTRYHSLILNPKKKQVTESPLEITALDQNSQSLIMAVNHKSLPIRGVQFHPESSGSVDGIELFREFLAL